MRRLSGGGGAESNLTWLGSGGIVTSRLNAAARGNRMTMRAPFVAAVVLSTGLGGCTVGPDYHPLHVVTSGGWSELAQPLPATRPTQLPSVATTRPVSVAEWWTTFNDPALNELIAQAVRSNNDLRLTESRIREARAQRGVVAGRLYPQVNADGTYLHSRVSETGVPIPGPSVSGGGQLPDITPLRPRVSETGVPIPGASVSGGGQLRDIAPRRPPDGGSRAAGGGGSSGSSGTSSIFGFGRDFDLFQIGFDAAWEIDVFGGPRRSV